MPWIHPWDKQEEDLQDQKKSIIMHLKACPKEDSFKEEEEEDVPSETSGKWNVTPVTKREILAITVPSTLGTNPRVKDEKPLSMTEVKPTKVHPPEKTPKLTHNTGCEA